MKIIDISHHDTHEDLTKYDGVLIKAEEGVNCPDESLNANVTAARAAGIPFGLYHYLSFRSDVNAQIAEFKAALAKYPDAALRPALDVEFDGRINQTLPADINDRIKAFASSVDGIMLYANPNMLGKLNAAVCGALPLWQAEYNPKPRDIPGYNRIGWQYRENPDESDFTDAVMLSGAVPSSSAPAPAPAFTGDPAVLAYQQKLNRIQIPRPLLDEDGKNGPKTQDAVRVLETVCGLTVDTGVWGGQCESAYNQIISKPMLQTGSNGLVVRYLQYRLGIKFDGDFGSQTANTLKAFQCGVGLDADGICGPNTWAKLIG